MAIPRVITTSPLNGETNVPQDIVIYITVNTALLPSSVNQLNVILSKMNQDGTSTQVPANISYDQTNNIISVLPVSKLDLGSTYRVLVKGDNNYNDLIKVGILSINNEPMYGDYTFVFTITDITVTPPSDDEEEDEIVQSGVLQVLATDPPNGTIMYTGLSTIIRFNDDVIIPNSGETTFHKILTSEEEVLKYHIKIYKTTTYGSESYHYITDTINDVNYDYMLEDDILTLEFASTGYPLPYNSKFIVTISPGLSGIHTYPMDEVYQYSFTWFLTPLYTTPQMVRYNAGPFLNFATDEYIYQLINAKSMEIYRIFKEAGSSLPFYPDDSGIVPSYVSQWVLCSVKLDLFRQFLNNAALYGGRVTLGDFTVDQGDIGKYLLPEINDLEKCVEATRSYISDLLYPKIDGMIPHLYDTRAPWYDREGRYRHTWKGEDLE